MQAFVVLSAVCFLGCASAAPCTSSCQTTTSTSSTSCTNSAYSFFQTYYTTSYSYNYYDAAYCLDYGINTIPGYLPTIMLEDLEYQFNLAKCKLLESYSCFPQNIGPILDQYSPDQLTYDYVFFGASTTTFFAVQQLAALGKKIAVVDAGGMYSPLVNSMYYRHALLNSQYVRPFQGYIPGCEVVKNLYAPNMVGGLSMLEYQTWDLGYRKFYDQFTQFNSQFSWDSAYSYYQKYEHCETKETCTKVECDACGTMSITKTVKETSVTKCVNSVFTEMGYSNNGAGFDINRSQGLSYLPYIGSGDQPLNIPEYIFNNIQSIDNIDFILNVEVDKLLISGGVATGLQVIGPNGPVIIECTSELILASSPLLIYELLVKSGCAQTNLLNTLGVPPALELPYLGNNLMVTHNYCGSFLRLPAGSLIQEFESDYTAMAFAFGESYLSSSSLMSYYKAYFAVGGSTDVNVQLSFNIFSKYMSRRMQLELLYYFQLDQCAIDYVLEMCNNYDLVFLSYTLLDSRSMGYISYKSSFTELDLNLGMYTDQYDIDCMLETIEISRRFAETSIFSSMGAELMQLPIAAYPGQFFTTEVNLQSLYYHSYPSFNVGGILPIGTDVSNSIVNSDLYIHGTTNVRCLTSGISPSVVPFESMAFNSFLANYVTNIMINGGSSSSTSTYSSSTRSLNSGPLGPAISPSTPESGPISCTSGPGPMPSPSGPAPMPSSPGSGPMPSPCGSGPMPSAPLPCCDDSSSLSQLETESLIESGSSSTISGTSSVVSECVDQSSSGISMVDQSSSGMSMVDQSSSTSSMVDQTSSGISMVDQSSSASSMVDQSSSGISMVDQSSSTSSMVDQSSSASSMVDQCSGGIAAVDQSSSSFVEESESSSSFNNGAVSGSSFSESKAEGSEYEYENTVAGPNGVTSVCAEGSEYSSSQASGSSTVIEGCGC